MPGVYLKLSFMPSSLVPLFQFESWKLCLSDICEYYDLNLIL